MTPRGNWCQTVFFSDDDYAAYKAPATLVDVQMVGASGRISPAGETADLKKAQKRIAEVLKAVKGR